MTEGRWYRHEANGIEVIVHPDGSTITYALGHYAEPQNFSLLTHADLEMGELEGDFRDGTDLVVSPHSLRFPGVEDATGDVFLCAMFEEGTDGYMFPKVEIQIQRSVAKKLLSDLSAALLQGDDTNG